MDNNMTTDDFLCGWVLYEEDGLLTLEQILDIIWNLQGDCE